MSTDESIAAWLDIARAAEQAGIRAQVTVSAAFGCPFEGEIAVERVVEVATRVAEARPFEIALADTIGVGVPTQVTELASIFEAKIDDVGHDAMTIMVAGGPHKLDAMSDLLQPFGIVELQRTGRIALPKLARRPARPLRAVKTRAV